ncbi:hypothetical protein CBS147321_7956 [Aspergillus niger]|nr:hypothetical protein CBS12448_10792 [Aspergillus niger]KAI2870572.1 hypothetical protein CBS11852_11091 [Aspergillus niger]KAI2937241.1 hypothetical protein CBS147321_7956 [Aspergillus niger]KAI2944537.1 hypothetical protein CBS147322_8066 [Aspergillus niger]KAI2985592.1 hypothetical protein CBS147345_11018 [Aspergillus niger]
MGKRGTQIYPFSNQAVPPAPSSSVAGKRGTQIDPISIRAAPPVPRASKRGTPIQPSPVQVTRLVPPPSAPVSAPKNSQSNTQGVKQRTPNRQTSHHVEDTICGSTVVQYACPWDTLKELFTCQLAGPVSVAVHGKNPVEVIAVRAYEQIGAKKWQQVLDRTQHRNVISAKEIFIDHGLTYFIVDDLPLTLDHVVACNDFFPTQLELASMLVQVLDGLSHLLELGFEHEKFECGNILLGQNGVIKIAGLEYCVECERELSHQKSIRAIADITMHLVQKHLKPDGAIGIDINLDQAETLAFVSTTTSATRIEELRKVC